MIHRKSSGAKIHYYSDRLKQKLSQLPFVPATVVEAPSGYGKTTAIRDVLQHGIPQGTPVHWFAAVDESPRAGFRRLCCTINKIDKRAGERLLKIGLPNSANAGEACDALRSIQCSQETYLVIDNFQIIQSFLPVSFFSALVEHGGKGLHIIIITQILKHDNFAALADRKVLHITADDLRLNATDIQRYYALAGVKINQEEAKELAHYTEGWITAVYLQLCAFRENISIPVATGIVFLMEQLVWDSLTDQQQVFLLHLSPFKTATVQQACALTGCSELPEYALEVLNNPFINYDPGLRQYEVHSILYELALQKRKERGAEFERSCLQAAGDYCRDNGKIDMALGFYMQAGDYEKMLSLNLSGLLTNHIGSTPFYELALDIARNCPYEVKQSHILSMLQVAWAILASGNKPEFDCLMDELNGMLEKDSDDEGSSLLRGEWLLLSSWRCLPRLAEMAALVQQAFPLFRGTTSRVILPSVPWCFGDYCQVAVFHSRPGEADREAEALEEFIAIYTRLTGGHGSGADVLFRAELEHFRGNLDEAETLARQASHLAQRDQQSIVQLGAALRLAEIAVEKCDADAWQRAISSIEQAAYYPGQDSFVLHSAVDMLKALLLNQLKHQACIPEWLKNGDTSGRLLPAMQDNALFVRLGYLMHEGEFARLAGMVEARRKMLSPDAVLADILFSLLAAVGYMFLGNTARAWECLDGAAQKAVPDGFLYLLAVYNWTLQGLPEKLIQKQYPEKLARFLEIKERFLAGFLMLHNSLAANDMPGTLTAREREVALLAAQGLRNSEIASKLMVSENTVRFHLRSVFQKLDIDRRAKLAEKLK